VEVEVEELLVEVVELVDLEKEEIIL